MGSKMDPVKMVEGSGIPQEHIENLVICPWNDLETVSYTHLTSAMGLKWSEVVSGFLAPRYPLARVVTECEAPLNAPQNSLDIMRFIERKKI